MPAAQRTPIDREAVKTLAIAVGVREAARQLDLSESTVKSWSTRERWFAQPDRVHLPPTLEKAHNPLASSASKPSSALVNVLADESKKTRLKLSRAAYKAAKTFAKRPGDAIIADSQALRHVTAVAATVHGWEEGKPASLNLQLGVFVGGIQ